MIRHFAAGVAVIFSASIACAADATLADGNWRLCQVFGVNEAPLFLMKVEKKDGKPTATVIGENTQWKVGDLKVAGSTLTLPVSVGGSKYTFEGTLDPKDAQVVRGALFNDSRTFRMALFAQEGDKLERPKAASLPKAPEPMLAVQKLTSAIGVLRNKARMTKDANEKAELMGKVKEAQKEADEKSPGLLREVIAKHADSPFAVEAATQLLHGAAKEKATAAEVATWVKLIEADAARYGSRIAKDTELSTAESLVTQKGVAAMALPLAEKIVGGLKEKDTLAVQSRALKLLAAAQKAAGKTDAGIENRLAKVEKALDEEYAKTVPPFTPAKFAGRKDKGANRVVVMELFTGAQCPPCVAADVAFDALEKSYEHKDLILLQYHMHIPGPDPLTNPNTIARWDYYAKLFPSGVRGTPTTVFNGKTFDQYDKNPMHGGGGGMANSENKFEQYKEIIDKLLEEKTDLKIGGDAKLAGDKVMVDLNVDGVKEPSDKIKLRVILLEEKIKYVGGNGLRFHHHVVRNVIDGPALTGKSLKKTIEINVGEVKKGLVKYLDEFATERPFPYPDRPLDMKHLKAVALVQNDDTGEILNAVQMDVK